MALDPRRAAPQRKGLFVLLVWLLGGDTFHPECANRHRGEDRRGMTRSDYTPGEEAESEQEATTLFPPRKPGGQPLVTYLPLCLQKSLQTVPPAQDQVFKHLSLESRGVSLPTTAAHTETVSIFSCSMECPRLSIMSGKPPMGALLELRTPSQFVFMLLWKLGQLLIQNTTLFLALH